jgi:hypothetical protein
MLSINIFYMPLEHNESSIRSEILHLMRSRDDSKDKISPDGRNHSFFLNLDPAIKSQDDQWWLPDS